MADSGQCPLKWQQMDPGYQPAFCWLVQLTATQCLAERLIPARLTAPGAAHTAHAEQNTALDVDDLEVKLAGTFLFKPKVDLFPGHSAVFQPSALLKVTDGHCILIWILSPENALCMKKMQANVIVKKQASVLAIACPWTQEWVYKSGEWLRWSKTPLCSSLCSWDTEPSPRCSYPSLQHFYHFFWQ